MNIKFQRGYLFPELKGSGTRKGIQAASEYMEEEKQEGRKTWGVWGTSLSKYGTYVGITDFERYLIDKAAEVEKQGRTLNVLEIGAGSGQHILNSSLWGIINYAGSVLHLNLVKNAIRKNIFQSTAGNIHDHVDANQYDIVISHFGTHAQEREALEDILHVLRPGGEAIIIGQGRPNPVPEVLPEYHARHYRIITRNPGEEIGKNPRPGGPSIFGTWGYHIRKN